MKKVFFIIVVALLQAVAAQAGGTYRVFGFNGIVQIEENGKWADVKKSSKIQSDTKFRLSANSSIKIQMPDSKLVSYDKKGTVTLKEIVEKSNGSLFASLLGVLFGDKEESKAGAVGQMVRGESESSDAKNEISEKDAAQAIYVLLRQMADFDFNVFNNSGIVLQKIADEEGAYHYAVENGIDVAMYFTILQINDDNSLEFLFNFSGDGKDKVPVMYVEPYSSVDIDAVQFAENGKKSLLIATEYPFSTSDVYELFESGIDPDSLQTKSVVKFFLLK